MSASREFAVDVVHRLRGAGFEALWAGGCVRDQILGLEPKDYDVATNARPEQVRDVFGRRRTLAIGQAFGVITVLGPKRTDPIEVATFRSDASYSDGRHPDSVTFSTAEADAQRRDFTINGLFYDPLDERVIDFVGGQTDLQRGIVRAIGDPLARISEDKLRMLRAVRIAANFGFQIEPATFAAIQQQAHEIVIVSAERIAAELRRMLVHPNRVSAVTKLRDSGLLEVILPESQAAFASTDSESKELRWQRTLAALAALDEPTFAVAFAALVYTVCDQSPRHDVQAICRRLKFSNAEIKAIEFVLEHDAIIRRASEVPWPKIQRILISPFAPELLQYSTALATAYGESTSDVDFCRQKLALPRNQLDPAPLIDGNALKDLGISPGPQFKAILDEIRDRQLMQQIQTRDQAAAVARSLAEKSVD